MAECIARAQRALSNIRLSDPVGRVIDLGGGSVVISGLCGTARIGDRVGMAAQGREIVGEVLRINAEGAHVIPDSPIDGLTVGSVVRLLPPRGFAPDESWIGRVIDPDGKPLDGRPLLGGAYQRRLRAQPPHPSERRAMGERMTTGLAVFDTLLPIARGQRIGLFAGSGVGKSTLIGELARAVDAEVIVIGLVGERGRELREFVEKVLGPEGLARSVIVTATSDTAPQLRRRCAWAAMAVAEHFRDDGRQVLLLMDSVTRFAEAHRELCVAAGEPATMRGFPASTAAAIASLCERAGPGANDAGDITAVFSVLVAGSDMEEPIADMVRGVLDGHVVLDRTIAERGRFPAIDLLRSVSRSLPDVAEGWENKLIGETRQLLGLYDRSEMMVQAGLYTAGSDPALDRAIAAQPGLDRFLALREPRGPASSFAALKAALPAG